MVTALIIGIGIFLVFLVGVMGFFLYSLIIKNKSMNGEQKTKALDVFMYLGIAISLIVSVGNILQIIFTAVDRRFPDLLTPSSSVDLYSSDVRLAIASLVVMYPLYLVLSWRVVKDISKFLYKRDLGVRKVMIYATLFITICTLIGALVSLIYNYLGGDLSIRFTLKAATVFVVAGSVFWYYFYSVKRDYTKKTPVPIIATTLSTIIVVASLIWSVGIIGTPAEMRARRIDSTRLSDLSSIQQQVFSHFQTTDKLPVTLSELNDAFQDYSVPIDPVTKEQYRYTIVQQPTVRMNYTTQKKELVKSAIFELCANFDMERNNTGQGSYTSLQIDKTPKPLSEALYSANNYYYEYDPSPFWNHGVGEMCFKRVISPDMYYGNTLQ